MKQTTLAHDNAATVFDALERTLPEAFKNLETGRILPPEWLCDDSDEQVNTTTAVFRDESEDAPPRVERIEPLDDLRPPRRPIEEIIGSDGYPPLEGQEGFLRGLMDRRGFDAYAWYRPRHFYPRSWGIYVRESGLLFVAAQFHVWMRTNPWKRSGGGRPGKEAHPSAWALCFGAYFVYRHENFHFLTELFATKAEAILSSPRFIEYFRQIYQTGLRDGTCHEEHLAMYEACVNHRINAGRVVDAVKPLIMAMPEAYRKVASNIWPRPNAPLSEWQSLAGQIVLRGGQTAHPLRFAFPMPGRWGVEHYANIPTYLYCDLGGRLMQYLKPYNPTKPRYKAVGGP